MRGWLVGAAVAAVVLLPAAPATTATPHVQPVVAGTVLRPLPDLRDRPEEGCTVPIGAVLSECPGAPYRPPVSCVVPAAVPAPGPGAGTLVPECPPYDPSPRSRVVPVPLSR